MFKALLRRVSRPNSIIEKPAEKVFFGPVRDDGLVFPSFCEDDLLTLQGNSRDRALYLLQLQQEGYLRPAKEDTLLPWEQLFALLDNPEHTGGLLLLELPPELVVIPMLASEGGLSDPGFKVFIRGWRKEDGKVIGGALAREGAFFTLDGLSYRLSSATWNLLQAVRELARKQSETPGETTNQLGWAAIHKKAHAA